MIGSSLTIRFFTSTIRAFLIVCCPESSTYSDSDTSLEYVSVKTANRYAATSTCSGYAILGRDGTSELISKTVLSRVISNNLYKELLTFLNSK